MLDSVPTPLLLLLHEGGWDEVLMVAVGLGLAYLVIMWTGRRSRHDDDEDDDDSTDEADGVS
ncbi:MAG: hypothetical protein IT306_01090 [Chloroflexi bacterium]|nr:hypothetical protein [Chloroflexota bacterium]